MGKSEKPDGFDINSLSARGSLLDDLEGNVDKELGIGEILTKSKMKALTLLDISKIEDEKKVKFHIDVESQSIELSTSSGELIGYIKPGFYTYGNVSEKKHLERKVYDEFTGDGFGQLLFDVYSGLKFEIPDEEYTHKPSVILFLQANGYRLTSRFDESGQIIELDDIELAQLESDLILLRKTGDADLDYTYKMVL